MREADVLARVRGPGLDDDLLLRHAHGNGNVRKDLGLGLGEQAGCEGARVPGEDEQGRDPVEEELSGPYGDADVEAAEAEDGGCGAEGHVHAVVVVDGLGIAVGRVRYAERLCHGVFFPMQRMLRP